MVSVLGGMADVIDFNSERKRRAGLADTGCCETCGEVRYLCRIINCVNEETEKL